MLLQRNHASHSPRSGKKHSLSTYLIWLVIATLLPGVIGATLLVFREYRDSRDQLERNSIQTVRALVQAVDIHLLRVQTLAETLTTSESLRRGDLAGFHQQARETMATVGLGTNIVLRDAEGRQVLNTLIDFHQPILAAPAPEQVRQVFATGKPVISNLFVGPVIQRPVMSVDVPVFIDGEIAYALGVGIMPEHFNAVLRAQGLPPDWIASVFDRSGTIVARTLSPEKFVGQRVTPSFARLLQKSPEGTGIAASMEGIRFIPFYSQSRHSGLGVSIGMPADIVEGALGSTILIAGISMAILLGVSLLLARGVSSRIAREVQALRASATALGEGCSVEIPDVEIKEVNDVAGALQRAAGLLQERSASLRAREAELMEAHRLARFGTWSWSAANGRIRVSASVRDMIGEDLPSFAALRGTLLAPEAWARLDVTVRHAVHTRSAFDIELPLRSRQHGLLWLDCKGEAVRRGERVVGLRGTVQDITARKRDEEKRREMEEELRQFKFFSDNANDGLLLCDERGRIRYVNKLMCERLGYSEKELLALQVGDVDPLYTREHFLDIFVRSRQGRIPPFESEQRRKDGSVFPVEITATVLEVRGELLMFATSRDITERKLAEHAIRNAALHDILTGLPNRAMVMDYCEHALGAARRNHSQGALLFIDLDRFKPINDIYGHETGDRVLQEVGKRLKACTREEDMVGRLGGDEFVIVLPFLDAGRHRAAAVAQHVVEAISQPFRLNGLELSLSPSIGISYFLEQADNASDLIHTADMAMYQAKQSGRGNFHFYTPDLDARAEHALKIEMRLKQALNEGGFSLHYQPVIELASGRLVGAEALLRLNAPNGESIGPDQFIPVAESAGLIGALGEWVLIEACRQQATWYREGMPLKVAINISPMQFRQNRFAERLSNIITDSGIDPACLEIEVTESAVMEDVDEAVAILERVKLLGVRVSLDDFGTAYSNLGSLTSLPLDKLKVDQSFVRRIERDPASRAVTEAIIALARSLRLEVVGEGIESERALQYLQERGCDLAQGFWFSKPMAPADFTRWWTAREESSPLVSVDTA